MENSLSSSNPSQSIIIAGNIEHIYDKDGKILDISVLDTYDEDDDVIEGHTIDDIIQYLALLDDTDDEEVFYLLNVKIKHFLI